MKTRNTNLLFNKLYYDSLGQGDFEKKVDAVNRELCQTSFLHARDFNSFASSSDYIPDPAASYLTSHLKTVYPGMLIGIGLPHGSGKTNNDINIGFSFDYAGGQPYIPGSTVKGVLRNAFSAYPDAVAALLNSNAPADPWTTEDVRSLESLIFDNADTFLDAVLFDSDEYGLVLSIDKLAPHDENPVKSPNILSLLKIRPNVCFEFRFILKDSALPNGKKLTAKKKAFVFTKLLEEFGIGAKTNVGYGILEADENRNPAVPKLKSAVQAQPTADRTQNQNRPAQGNAQKVKCPHCQRMSFATYPDGNPRRTCSWKDCNKPLKG